MRFLPLFRLVAMMQHSDSPGFDLALGKESEGRSYEGRTGQSITAREPVSRVMSQYFAAALEDDNASYWDEDYAQQQWGGLLAPPGSLSSWMRPPLWRPDDPQPESPLLATSVPLPGPSLINVASDVEFHRPLRVGMVLTSRERIESVSPARQTSLGLGHFVTSLVTYGDQATGDDIATRRNTVLRFTPRRDVDDVPSRARLPQLSKYGSQWEWGLEFPVTHKTVIMGAAATMDYFRGHHDPEFAKRQGHRDIYLSTPVFQGLSDKAINRWFGHAVIVSRRSTRLLAAVYPGDVLKVVGRPDASGSLDSVLIEMFVGDTCVCLGNAVFRRN